MIQGDSTGGERKGAHMAGRLVFTSRWAEVRSVPLADGQVVVIGRGPGSDVRFADMIALSRLHCRVRAEGGRAWVERLYCRGEIRVRRYGHRWSPRVEGGRGGDTPGRPRLPVRMGVTRRALL